MWHEDVYLEHELRGSLQEAFKHAYTAGIYVLHSHYSVVTSPLFLWYTTTVAHPTIVDIFKLSVVKQKKQLSEFMEVPEKLSDQIW